MHNLKLVSGQFIPSLWMLLAQAVMDGQIMFTCMIGSLAYHNPPPPFTCTLISSYTGQVTRCYTILSLLLGNRWGHMLL
jgi:hypothetical protein